MFSHSLLQKVLSLQQDSREDSGEEWEITVNSIAHFAQTFPWANTKEHFTWEKCSFLELIIPLHCNYNYTLTKHLNFYN